MEGGILSYGGQSVEPRNIPIMNLKSGSVQRFPKPTYTFSQRIIENIMEMEDKELKTVEDEVLNFKLKFKSERSFARKKVVERNYSVLLDESWKDLRVEDGSASMIDLFNNVIQKVSEKYTSGDMLKLTISHPDLQSPITIPPKPLENVHGEEIIEKIEKVVTSNQNLTIDNLDIVVGLVEMPSGGGRKRIINVDRDVKLKQSMVKIENNDFMCAARAICVGYAKLSVIDDEDFQKNTNHLLHLSNVEKVLEIGKCTKRIYKDICQKDRPGKQITQKRMAELLCEKVKVPVDRCISINELDKFENVLDVNICVISAEHGNKFIRTGSHCPERKNIYLYLNGEHFDCISSITGFFSSHYFCEHCMKPYENRERHRCDSHCNVCLSYDCIERNPVTCKECNQTCRSKECYERHKVTKFKDTTMCEHFYCCSRCHKTMPRNRKAQHECGEYYCQNCERFVVGKHFCYLRAVKPETGKPNFIFYDFETTQETMIHCTDGYMPTNVEGCENCSINNLCNSCFKCQRCNESTCGRIQHVPNLVIAQTICEHCYKTDSTTCIQCGLRCLNCTKEVCEKCPKTKEHEGIRLDGRKICKKTGLRSLSKIKLNSFWGKFGQRLDFDKCQYFNSDQLAEFYEVLSNPTLDRDAHPYGKILSVTPILTEKF
ncbi:hypothetical protein KUTeg_018088 [Tegillarca granosa]|uniref:Uncharacterized protein n=1 Tax=Tegillarca granosa TaxID=220873 RepID=A0ABQ9EH17_TEGGR|nr:hypothetical protein KUTeg_018088 [Tegillarca granosa]